MMKLMLGNLKNYFPRITSRKKGQGMVEYALLIGLIAIVVIAVLLLLGPAISNKFQEIINNL